MVELVFFLDGNIPPKKNRPRIFIRKGRTIRVPSKAHEDWHKLASYQLAMQKTSCSVKLPIEKCKEIELELYYGTRITKDNTNTADSVHDLLTDSGIIVDDNWKVTGRTIQTPIHRKNEPGCKIMIRLPDSKDSKND